MAASAIDTWLFLWKTTRAVEVQAHQSILNLGLGVSDFAVLEALLHKGPLLVNTLGKMVLLTSGSMTAAVDRLEQQGLVERRNVPGDRRARMVHLTGKGNTLIKKAFAQHESDVKELMAALTAEERKVLIGLLGKLRRTADESEGEKDA